VAVEVFVVIFCLGGATSYVVVIGDISEAIFRSVKPQWPVTTVRVVAQCGCYVAILLPLSLLRTLGALKYASAIGVVAIFILFFTLSAQAIDNGTQSNFQPMVGDLSGVVSSLPVLFFAFGNQINAVEIYSELRNRSPWAFGKVVVVGTGLVGVAFLVIGFSGLSLFGSGVAGNVLSSMNPNNPSTVISLIGVGLKVVLSFPLVMYPCREALLHMVGVQEVRNATLRAYGLSTVALSGVALGLAIAVPQVVLLFGLLGSICGSLFSFILPAVLGLESEKYWEGLPSSSLHRAMCFALLVVGLFVAISGTYFSVLSIQN
jgi:amino acid permease